MMEFGRSASPWLGAARIVTLVVAMKTEMSAGTCILDKL
jgi:hypothetical protein